MMNAQQRPMIKTFSDSTRTMDSRILTNLVRVDAINGIGNTLMPLCDRYGTSGTLRVGVNQVKVLVGGFEDGAEGRRLKAFGTLSLQSREVQRCLRQFQDAYEGWVSDLHQAIQGGRDYGAWCRVARSKPISDLVEISGLYLLLSGKKEEAFAVGCVYLNSVSVP
jgi:hypothetical protein